MYWIVGLLARIWGCLFVFHAQAEHNANTPTPPAGNCSQICVTWQEWWNTQTFDWPAKSPDVSCKELLWNGLQQQVKYRNRYPLYSELHPVSENVGLNWQELKTLVALLPDRTSAVIKVINATGFLQKWRPVILQLVDTNNCIHILSVELLFTLVYSQFCVTSYRKHFSQVPLKNVESYCTI